MVSFAGAAKNYFRVVFFEKKKKKKKVIDWVPSTVYQHFEISKVQLKMLHCPTYSLNPPYTWTARLVSEWLD